MSDQFNIDNIIRNLQQIQHRGDMIKTKRLPIGALYVIILLIAGCTAVQPKPAVETGSAAPAGTVMRGNTTLHLTGSPIAVGEPLPLAFLVEAADFQRSRPLEGKGQGSPDEHCALHRYQGVRGPDALSG